MILVDFGFASSIDISATSSKIVEADSKTTVNISNFSSDDARDQMVRCLFRCSRLANEKPLAMIRELSALSGCLDGGDDDGDGDCWSCLRLR